MRVLDLLAGAAGAFLVVWSLRDLFISVIVPRSVGGRFRPSVLISRYGWRSWRAAALRITDMERREDTLAVFAPTFMITLLAYWVASQVVGLGLLFWALRGWVHPEPTLGEAIYFAGASLLTIGYGDYAPVHWVTRVLALFAGASGLGTFAIVTTFLFQTVSAFQRREAFIVTIAERTGAPPSGLEFLMRHIKLGMVDDIGTILRESQRWLAEVMETHLAYPVLTYFRSSHDDESWVGTIGALLDASALIVTTVRTDQRGEAVLFNRLGRHLVSDLSNYFRIGDEFRATGIERAEFNAAYERLRAKGVPLIAEDAAWSAFAELRGTYAGELNAMARYFRIPPAQWIGDRSSIATRHR